METEFAPFKIALRLKDIGFNDPCLRFYDGDYLSMEPLERQGEDWTLAPLYQQVFRWFREKHSLEGWVQPSPKNTDVYCWGIAKPKWFKIPHECSWNDLVFETHKRAETSCIEKLINIVEEKVK